MFCRDNTSLYSENSNRGLSVSILQIPALQTVNWIREWMHRGQISFVRQTEECNPLPIFLCAERLFSIGSICLH